MAVISDHCPDIEVTLVDIDENKIAAWNDSDLMNLPIYEPGLKEVVKRNRNRNLFFSTNIEKAIGEAEMIFISVNTPTKLSGLGAGYASDLKWVESSARQVAKYSKGHTIIVEKSTVPVKTAELIKDILMNSENDRDVYYLIQKRVMISGEELIDANPGFDQDGNPAVMFALSTLGGKKFGRITGKNIGKPFAIVLDNKVISAPVIQGQIFSNGQITGNFSVQESRDLALVLRAGALPVPLTILEERSVGPGLGKDSIEAGKFASLIAIVVVMIFMLIYYGIYGLFANVSLIMNMVFLISVLTIIQATLTLPGIAGIVLTIGMAVDANVLIFERIREENLLRKNILESIDQGFKRAVSTILDANLTTFIAAFALFIFGSGPIKGFSVTLMIGLITSMFTAIIITKYQIITYAKRQTRDI